MRGGRVANEAESNLAESGYDASQMVSLLGVLDLRDIAVEILQSIKAQLLQYTL